jgi:hypothetical protein
VPVRPAFRHLTFDLSSSSIPPSPQPPPPPPTQPQRLDFGLPSNTKAWLVKWTNEWKVSDLTTTRVMLKMYLFGSNLDVPNWKNASSYIQLTSKLSIAQTLATLIDDVCRQYVVWQHSTII